MHTDISLERVKQAFKEKAIEIPGRRPRKDHCWQHLLCMLFQSVKLVFKKISHIPLNSQLYEL